jgi:hypothetical protein
MNVELEKLRLAHTILSAAAGLGFNDRDFRDLERSCNAELEGIAGEARG